MHSTFKRGTTASPSKPVETAESELQGVHNRELQKFTNDLMAHYRDLHNFVIHVSRLPNTKNYEFSMTTWTNTGVIEMDLNGVPIRGIFIENYSATVGVSLYQGSNASGGIPLIVCNKATWHRLPVDEGTMTVSLAPVSSAGGETCRVVLSSTPYSPAMGATV